MIICKAVTKFSFVAALVFLRKDYIEQVRIFTKNIKK